MPTKRVSIPALEQDDYLYHLGITSENAKELYGDVKFVCCGGSPKRMTRFAGELAADLGLGEVAPIGKTDRFTWFKVGPVIVSSHGMGQPSISILLHEVTKLLSYAEATDVMYFRLGSSGGIGVPPGTVVLTTEAMDGQVKPQFTLPILGKLVSRPTKLDESLIDELEACAATGEDVIAVAKGRTMATDCFYEGQARLDGAICDYTLADKMAFLQRLKESGVYNIEMEAGVFSSFTHHLGIRGAICCVTLLDRLAGDQVLTSPEELADFDTRPGRLLRKFIKEKVGA